jgi:hypothetical protein
MTIKNRETCILRLILLPKRNTETDDVCATELEAQEVSDALRYVFLHLILKHISLPKKYIDFNMFEMHSARISCRAAKNLVQRAHVSLWR